MKCIDFKLRSNFWISEFSCPHCGSVHVSEELADRLQLLRSTCKAPVIIVSGYRCKEYNDSIPGADPDSFHIKGMAADIHITGYEPEEIYYLADKLGFKGIGIYDTWVHVDVASYIHRWDKRVKNKGKEFIKKIVV